jgi:hypothetical protein
MKVMFTYKQIAPIVARLKEIDALGPQHRPSSVTPVRWQKLLAGKTAHLTVSEMNGIARTIGWHFLLGIKSARQPRPGKRTKAA